MKEDDKPAEQAKLPGGLTIWQAGGVTMGSMLLTAAMGVNTLMERSANDREAVKMLQGEVRKLSSDVNALTNETTRLNAVLLHLKENVPSFRNSLREPRN